MHEEQIVVLSACLPNGNDSEKIIIIIYNKYVKGYLTSLSAFKVLIVNSINIHSFSESEQSKCCIHYTTGGSDAAATGRGYC